MNMNVDLNNVIYQVHSVALLLASSLEKETEIGRFALVHAIHNRLSQGEQISNIEQEINCAALKDETDGNSEAQEVRYLKALSIVALVFSGHDDDPTSGANRFHMHDLAPEWAAGHEAVALIGGRFYYRF